MKTQMITKIKNVLRADPTLVGTTFAQTARNIREATVQQSKALTSTQLLAWAGARGRAAQIEDAATNKNLPLEVRSLAIVMREMLRRSDLVWNRQELDPVEMLRKLAAGGVLDPVGDVEDLAVRSRQRVAKYPDLQQITEYDIQAATTPHAVTHFDAQGQRVAKTDAWSYKQEIGS